jgi:hypothetical protein
MGMNPALRAPSLRMRRTALGTRNAAKKASATGPAPRAFASSTSRTNPSTRDRELAAATIRVDRIRDMRRTYQLAQTSGGSGSGLSNECPFALEAESPDVGSGAYDECRRGDKPKR